MRRKERVRAIRISEYVDSLLVQRRTREEHASPIVDDGEFRELMKLAGTLSRIDMGPPPSFGDRLLTDIRRQHGAAETKEAVDATSFADIVRRAARRLWQAPPAWRAVAVSAGLIAIMAVLGGGIWRSRPVSAAEILTRADAALANMVRPGDVLYRRWLVVERTQRTPGAAESVQQRFVEEWLDGNDLRHVAGRSFTTAGKPHFSYTTVLDKGEYRPRVYFAPGYFDSPGLLSVEPTRREFLEAAATFRPDDRRRLAEYLARGYIYEPFIGERRYNRGVIEDDADEILPRTRLSLDAAATLDGVPVYKIRAIDPVRVRFRWRQQSPAVWLARHDTVRYVSRDTHLSLRTEDVVQHETGERVVISSELIETRVSATADELHAFDLTVPEGTPTEAQSAFALLSQVAKALNRVSPNASTEEKEP